MDEHIDLESVFESSDAREWTLHTHEYVMTDSGRSKGLNVLTPPDYDTSDQYPVLYLLNEMGTDHDAWLSQGKVEAALANLLAAGRIQPMIAVLADGHALPVTEEGFLTKVWDPFEREMLADIIPLVRKHYSISDDRFMHAIAGTSLGACHSVRIGLRQRDQFAWIGAFSGGAFEPESDFAEVATDATVNEQMKLVQIQCVEEDFVVIFAVQDLHDWLEAKGIRHEYLIDDGEHDWQTWRRYFINFITKLF